MEEPKRFEPKRVEDVADEPQEFYVGTEKFVCLPRTAIPSGALRRLSTERWTVEVTCSFIESVLYDKDDEKDETPTQIERWRRVLDDKTLIIDSALLSDICTHVIGLTSSRPTKPLSGSTSGRKRTAATSKAKRSGRGSTSAA